MSKIFVVSVLIALIFLMYYPIFEWTGLVSFITLPYGLTRVIRLISRLVKTLISSEVNTQKQLKVILWILLLMYELKYVHNIFTDLKYNDKKFTGEPVVPHPLDKLWDGITKIFK